MLASVVFVTSDARFEAGGFPSSGPPLIRAATEAARIIMTRVTQSWAASLKRDAVEISNSRDFPQVAKPAQGHHGESANVERVSLACLSSKKLESRKSNDFKRR